MDSTHITRRKMACMVLATPLLGVLPACQNAPAAPRPTTLIGTPLRLGVASIDIINAYTPTGEKPYIDHVLTPNPATQITDWAGRILIPAAGRGNLLINITRAALIETHLEGEDSLKGLFTNEQARLVRAELEAYFSFSHPHNNRSASLTVKAAYETSIAENTTPRGADTIRLYVIDEALGRFDAEFRRQIEGIANDGINGGWPRA